MSVAGSEWYRNDLNLTSGRELGGPRSGNVSLEAIYLNRIGI